MRLYAICILILAQFCHAFAIDYEFHAFSRADLDAAREESPAIAVPRLLHCAQFGLYRNVDGSPTEKKIALNILRTRGDFGEWFREQLRPHVQPGFEYRETRYGGRMKFARFAGLDPQISNDVCFQLFNLLDLIGTYESLVVALEYCGDDRHFIEPGADYGSLSIGGSAMDCVRSIARRLNVAGAPANEDPDLWKDWVARNKVALQKSSHGRKNEN